MLSHCIQPLMRNQLLILLGFSFKQWVVLLLLLSRFSPYLLTYSIFTIMCLFWISCNLSHLGVQWAFKTCRLMFFNLSSTVSSNTFSAPFSLSFLILPLCVCWYTFLWLFIIVHSIFSLFFKLPNLYQIIFKLAISVFCQFKSITWAPLVNVSCHLVFFKPRISILFCLIISLYCYSLFDKNCHLLLL